MVRAVPRRKTVAEKPAYRAAFKARPCLVVADGFYEWAKVGPKEKQPYFITTKGRAPFVFAGLWELWRAKEAHKEEPGLERFTILTTEPNALCAPIHNRMSCVPSMRPARRTPLAFSGKATHSHFPRSKEFIQYSRPRYALRALSMKFAPPISKVSRSYQKSTLDRPGAPIDGWGPLCLGVVCRSALADGKAVWPILPPLATSGWRHGLLSLLQYIPRRTHY
jgi:SOS response associated peptidase (SRAP)